VHLVGLTIKMYVAFLYVACFRVQPTLSPAYKLNKQANNIKTWNILHHGLATEHSASWPCHGTFCIMASPRNILHHGLATEHFASWPCHGTFCIMALPRNILHHGLATEHSASWPCHGTRSESV